MVENAEIINVQQHDLRLQLTLRIDNHIRCVYFKDKRTGMRALRGFGILYFPQKMVGKWCVVNVRDGAIDYLGPLAPLNAIINDREMERHLNLLREYHNA